MNNQTIEKLRSLRLGAMASLHLQHVQQNSFAEMTCDEYLSLLTDHQWEDRENAKIERLLKQAAFRQQASLADISYSGDRNLDRNMFVLRKGSLGRFFITSSFCIQLIEWSILLCFYLYKHKNRSVQD